MMQRRDFLRGMGALAGLVLIDGIWQPHRKIFALGGLPQPRKPDAVIDGVSYYIDYEERGPKGWLSVASGGGLVANCGCLEAGAYNASLTLVSPMALEPTVVPIGFSVTHAGRRRWRWD